MHPLRHSAPRQSARTLAPASSASRNWARLALLALALPAWVSCESKVDEEPPTYDLRIGHVMVEVGYRFETAGRAAEAERWDLARYEVHEILEMFEDDMSRALLPGDCNDTIADGAFNVLDQRLLASLRDAAEAEDEAAFTARFAEVAAQCNTCHAGCNVSFVQVPTRPGLRVPTIDPPAAPARTDSPPPGEAAPSESAAAEPAPGEPAPAEAAPGEESP